VVRQAHLTAIVGVLLIGSAVLLVAVGCADGVGSEARHKEQRHSPQATSSEEARCEGTRTYYLYMVVYPNGQNSKVRSGSEEDMKKAEKKAGQKLKEQGTSTTNDLPGCPKGGMLLGTDKPDLLNGKHGDDKVRGLGGSDGDLEGGDGNDILYGGDGNDQYLLGGPGEDVIYGGDGNDILYAIDDGQRDKLYCGKGKDLYYADKSDYVDSSCERKLPSSFGGA
jgi:hypothetical protein